MEFSDLNMTKAQTKVPVIFIEGFEDPGHYTRNIILRNLSLPENSKIYLRNCDTITFENVVEMPGGKEPEYEIVSSTNIRN